MKLSDSRDLRAIGKTEEDRVRREHPDECSCPQCKYLKKRDAGFLVQDKKNQDAIDRWRIAAERSRARAGEGEG